MSLERVRKLKRIRECLAKMNEWTAEIPAIRFFCVLSRNDSSESQPTKDEHDMINEAINECVRTRGDGGDIVRTGSGDVGQFIRKMTLDYVDRLIVREAKKSKAEAEECLRFCSEVAG